MSDERRPALWRRGERRRRANEVAFARRDGRDLDIDRRFDTANGIGQVDRGNEMANRARSIQDRRALVICLTERGPERLCELRALDIGGGSKAMPESCHGKGHGKE